MLTIGPTGTIYLAVAPQDGRKGIDGLAGVVRAVLGRDPASGDLSVFKNRRATRSKSWPGWATDSPSPSADWRRGTFAFPGADARELAITPTQLAMILGGVELDRARTRPRFQKSA